MNPNTHRTMTQKIKVDPTRPPLTDAERAAMERDADAKLSRVVGNLMYTAFGNAYSYRSRGGQPNADLAFWAALISRMPRVLDWTIGTAATDGTRLFFDPRFVLDTPLPQLEGTFYHEGEHVVFGHPEDMKRLGAFGGARADRFNRAADYTVNHDLERLGARLPDYALRDPELGPKSALENYATLTEREQDDDDGKGGDGEGGEGGTEGEDTQGGGTGTQDGEGGANGDGEGNQSGEGDTTQGGTQGTPEGDAEQDGNGTSQDGPEGTQGEGDDGEGQGQGGKGGGGSTGTQGATRGNPFDGLGGVLPAPDTVPEGGVDPREAMQHALMISRGVGTVSEGLAARIDGAVKPVAGWREILRRFLSNTLPHRTSWARQHRRRAGFPGRSKKPRELVVAIDTSGSVDHGLATQFVAELNAILAATPTKVTVLYCDTQLQAVEQYAPNQRVEYVRHWGGGTDFAPVMEYVRNMRRPVSAVVYFTDGMCDTFGNDPRVPVLWAQYRDGVSYYGAPPFGVVLPVWKTARRF